MKVYIEFVGKHEFDLAKRIPGTWVLTQPKWKVSCSYLGPIYGFRVNLSCLSAPALEDSDAMLPEVIGIFPYQGQLILHRNVLRNVPIGVQNQIGHLITKDRGTPVPLPHHNPHRHQGLAVFKQIQLESRDVYENILLAEI